MDAIKMVGIVKCFGPVRANDGIDFTVKHQEIHCLLGENGTGKSTFSGCIIRMRERFTLMRKRHPLPIPMMPMGWESEWYISISCW